MGVFSSGWERMGDLGLIEAGEYGVGLDYNGCLDSLSSL